MDHPGAVWGRAGPGVAAPARAGPVTGRQLRRIALVEDRIGRKRVRPLCRGHGVAAPRRPKWPQLAPHPRQRVLSCAADRLAGQGHVLPALVDAALLAGVREEQLLAIYLIGGNGVLAGLGRHPVYELLGLLGLDVRELDRK